MDKMKGQRKQTYSPNEMNIHTNKTEKSNFGVIGPGSDISDTIEYNYRDVAICTE